MRRWLTWLSVALAVGATVFWLTVPAYRGGESGAEKTKTLVEINGLWALVVVAFPIGLALLPVTFPKRAVRILAAILLVLFSLLGSFTVGLAYLPGGRGHGLRGSGTPSANAATLAARAARVVETVA